MFQDFKIEWSCRWFDPRIVLDEVDEYHSNTSLAFKSITWTKTEETESAGNCFSDNKGTNF